MRNYLKKHAEQGLYGDAKYNKDQHTYLNVNGWNDVLVHDSLIFSHRASEYTQETFNKYFHSENFYKVIFYISGNVEYVCENDVYKPMPGMIVASLPGIMQTVRLLEDCKYDRYIFYFKDDFFNHCGEQCAMPDFFTSKGTHGALQPTEEVFNRLRQIVESAEMAASVDTPEGRMLACSYIVQFFALLKGDSTLLAGKNENLPENVARIKKYIDTYYSTIEGVSEIAAYFFYSREHASRLFRQYFNITLSEYLMQRRVSESAKLLREGQSVSQACYAVGFRSISSFINAFRRIIGCLPSEYKKRK